MNTTPVIDPKRLEAILQLPLGSGSHKNFDDGMCVMEAVAYVAGEPFSDHPKCASPVLSAFLRQFNDRLPNDKLRTELLGPLVPKLVGSKASPAVEEKRRWFIVNWLVHDFTPKWFELANKGAQARKMRELPEITPENRYEVAEQIRAIRLEAFGTDSPYWAWRNKFYQQVYDAAYAAALKVFQAKGSATAADDAAATAADDAATTAATAADDAATATATAATAADDAATAAADAADDAATAAADAADAAATAAQKKIPTYGTNAYWAWREKIRKEVYEATYERIYKRFDEALGGAIERSRKDAIAMIEKALEIRD